VCSIGKLRSMVREMLEEELGEIDEWVEPLLYGNRLAFSTIWVAHRSNCSRLSLALERVDFRARLGYTECALDTDKDASWLRPRPRRKFRLAPFPARYVPLQDLTFLRSYLIAVGVRHEAPQLGKCLHCVAQVT
jgi:hypothetical protein